MFRRHRGPSRSIATRLDRVLRLAVVLLGVVALLTVGRYLRYAMWYEPHLDHLLASRSAAAAAERAMLDQETGLRGYLLTGNSEFLDPYRRGTQAYLDASATLSAEADDDAVRAAARDAARSASRWQVTYAGPSIHARRVGDQPSPGDLARGKGLFDDYRAKAGALDAVMRQQAAAAGRTYNLTVGGFTAVELAALAGLVGFLAVGRRRLHRDVVAPVRDTLSVLSRLSDGDLSARPRATGTTELAAIGASVVELAQAVEHEQRHSQQREDRAVETAAVTARALELSRTINRSLDPIAVGRHAAAALAEIASATALVLWSTTPDGAGLVATLSTDLDVPVGATAVEPSLAQRAYLRTVVAGAAEGSDPAAFVEGAGRFGVPLVTGGACLGVVELVADSSALPTHRLAVMHTLALHAATALSVARLHAEVTELSERDPLTGLWNRRRLERDLAAALEELPGSRGLAFVMVDVDHFKAYNDRRGHPAGDSLLRAMGELLCATVRTSDTAYRYGGEEFALLLPDTGRDAAQSLAERLRQLVARHFLDEGVTASFGVTGAATPVSAAEVLEAADAALYDAKRRGRNRVAVAASIDDELRQARENAPRS